MKRILLILVLFCTTIAFSQKRTFESEVSKISKKIEQITQQEKDSLKMKVKDIEKRFEKGEITKTTSDILKKEVAQYHARKIEDRVGEQQKKLQQLIQDKTDGKIASVAFEENNEDRDEGVFSIGSKTFRLSVDKERSKSRSEARQKRRESRWNRKGKKYRSTTSQFVFALGINNVLINDSFSSIEDSEYKMGESHFYEVGFTWKSSFSRAPSSLYFKYGMSFLWNNLRLTGNRIHVKNNEITEFQEFPDNLSESRLRHVQMIIPLHLEWDLSRSRFSDDGRAYNRTNKSFRLGVGAFGGFKLGTRQYVEYRNTEGVKIKEVQKDNFNMNTINYGLSAYLAYRSTGVYVKYDMNPLFKNTEIRNISFGVRFDLN
jgi:hypothetical protein